MKSLDGDIQYQLKKAKERFEDHKDHTNVMFGVSEKWEEKKFWNENSVW